MTGSSNRSCCCRRTTLACRSRSTPDFGWPFTWQVRASRGGRVNAGARIPSGNLKPPLCKQYRARWLSSGRRAQRGIRRSGSRHTKQHTCAIVSVAKCCHQKHNRRTQTDQSDLWSCFQRGASALTKIWLMRAHAGSKHKGRRRVRVCCVC